MNYYAVKLSVPAGYSILGLAPAAAYLVNCQIPARFECRRYLAAELSEGELNGIREYLKRTGAHLISIEAELSAEPAPAQAYVRKMRVDHFR